MPSSSNSPSVDFDVADVRVSADGESLIYTLRWRPSIEFVNIAFSLDLGTPGLAWRPWV